MRKDKILESSLVLFANQGYFGTSMDDIARAVGIKKGSLYSHYAGKEDIFTAVFDGIVADYAQFIRNLTVYDDETNCPNKLKEIFAVYVRHCKNNDKMVFWDRYYYYPPEYLKDYIFIKTQEIEALFLEIIIRIVGDGITKGTIKNGNPRDIALAFYYMMIGFAMTIRFYDQKEIEPDILSCISVFLDGIRP